MIIKAKTFKKWTRANFTDGELKDMVNHGVDGGFHHLTYYSDTVKVYEHFKDEIFEKLVEMTDEMGHENVYVLLGSFNKDHMPGNYDQFANQLTWFMAEETAREILQEKGIEI